MLRYLKWGFHPAVLIVVSVVLVGAAGLVILPRHGGAGLPVPLPVRPGEQEVAWLYPATSTSNWERLADAVRQAQQRLQEQFPGLEWEHDSSSTATARAVPQIALHWPGGRGRLVLRWYKLTSQLTPKAWVEALLNRDVPPLAIIGGNNSYWARELAVQLQRAASRVPSDKRPLLLLTTATADRVPLAPQGKEDDPESALSLLPWSDDSRTAPLTELYAPRTYRFCFSNRQMATAVTRFLWSRLDLRPDADPAFLVQWMDDSYSQDFFDGGMRVLGQRALDNAAQQVGFALGAAGLRLHPAQLAGWVTSGFRREEVMRLDVDSSVGSFTAPNPFEAKAVRDLLAQLQDPKQVPRRPLLVLTGQQQPSRRFLRDLARSAPELARRFVVAAGDALSFNTVYRDREVTWPIQDLPFTLVFFAHRNPIDPEAGFQTSVSRVRSSGTEDVLLYRDIVEAVALAFRDGDAASRHAADLAAGLADIRLAGDRLRRSGSGVPLFGPLGQRSGGTGEHVVLVRPHFRGPRVLPRATIEVWARQEDRHWHRAGEAITVSYDESEVQHGDRPAGP